MAAGVKRGVPCECRKCGKSDHVWVSSGAIVPNQADEAVCECGGTYRWGTLKGSSWCPLPAGYEIVTGKYVQTGKFREPIAGDWGEKMLEHREFRNEGMF